MWHVLFSGVRLKLLFFREVKRFCFEDAYECIRVCVCVCVCVYNMCVCVLVCARERASTYVVCVLVSYPFLPFLKRSANALRASACVHVCICGMFCFQV